MKYRHMTQQNNTTLETVVAQYHFVTLAQFTQYLMLSYGEPTDASMLDQLKSCQRWATVRPTTDSNKDLTNINLTTGQRWANVVLPVICSSQLPWIFKCIVIIVSINSA